MGHPFVTRLTAPLHSLTARLTALLRRAAVAVFGHVSWQPPGWLRALTAFLLAHRLKLAALLLLAIAATFAGRYAYQHRPVHIPPPPPHFAHATLSEPSIPPLTDDDLAPATLRLDFDESAAALSLLNSDASAGTLALVHKPVPSNLVQLDPPLPGTWRWEGDRHLVFTLTGEWPAAQTLRVTVDPAALAPSLRLTTNHWETRTPPLHVQFTKVELYQNPKDLAVRQVTATILTSHAVSLADLEARLSADLLGHSPVFGQPAPGKTFSLTPGRHGREFYFRTVPLTLPANPDTLKLSLARGLPATAGGNPTSFDETATVAIPDLFSIFQIQGVDTKIVKTKDGTPEQFLLVNTTCEVRSEDLAQSLALYALPAENPARREEAESGHHDATDNDHGDADDSDDSAATTDDDPPTDDDDSARYSSVPGDHDGRFHDDEREDTTDAGTEKPEKLDLPDKSDDWAPNEVNARALARSRKLPLTLVPSAHETSTTHTFRFRDATPGDLFVKIAKNVPAPGGAKLRDDYAAVAGVPIPERELTIQGDGGLLALSGERKLSVQSRGLPAIRYEIARVPAAEINHLASQTRGSFQNPTFRNYRFNEQDLARISSDTQLINLRNPVEANYSTFDFTRHLQPSADKSLDREGLFFLTASGWDPQTNKYVKDISASRFVLVTDLGLLVKRNADGSRDVFVASLASGTPLGNTTVSILARSGATLAEAPTDDAGRASLPTLGKNPRDSREPVAIVARRGSDVAFLPYERDNRTLDFSRFDTEGVENRTGHELDAFVFTERGVYRPGDTVHVGVIVKQRDWNGSLDGLPLETEVVDARDQSSQVNTVRLPASGFVEWTADTAHDSPTGGYTLNVYLQRDGKRGVLLGSATVQVKEFLPDRLKLDVSLSKTNGPGNHGWVTPEDLHGNAILKNLYGTSAENHRVKAHLRLNPRDFAFKEYPDYTFFDRLRENKKDWEGETIELGDQQTAADGTAKFDFDLHRFADATYRLTFDAEGFEAEGGRSVEDLAGTLVSPLPYVVGWHADGDLNWIKAGGPGRTVQYVAVDPSLKQIPLQNLTLHFAEQQYLSVLTKDSDGNYRYESVRRERPIRDEPFPVSKEVVDQDLRHPERSEERTESKDLAPGTNSPSTLPPSLPPPEATFALALTAAPAITLLPTLSSFANFADFARGPQPAPLPNAPPSAVSASAPAFILHPSSFTLPTDTPGNFLVELRDASGQPVSRLEYTVVGQGEVKRSLEKNAELQIHLDHDQYKAGDEIEISITAPYAGSGLITLERERVYTHRWFTATTNTSIQKITIPPDFDGTGYVNVSFLRALDSKEIFMSPLSYAVAPFTANLERRRLHVDLHAAEKTKPGEPLSIHYHTDRPAKIAVFAVDQGILQVTKFPLPDPLAHQFRKSALTVRTSQIIDLLLPEFSLLRAAQSTGGDGDPGVLNPFRRVTEKPVVYWSGIVDADKTERTVTYPVPDYFTGTLTIMAVAVSPDALGNAKTSTLCRNAYVLTPTVPTLAAPGDEFEVGLTVANGETGSGPDAKVTVQAEPGPGLQIVRAPTGPLPVPEGHERSTTFRVRALDALGSAQLAFHATGPHEDSRVHSTLSIRPAMPFRTVVTSGHFPGGTKDVPVSGGGLYAEYRHLDATLSATPLGLARGLDRFLKEYPHGCSEQITSGAFARLALADLPGFGLTRAEAAAQIEHTMTIERRRQNDQGGFGFWDASKTPDIDFVTVYVMHFLSEAKAGGYPVQDDVFQDGLKALRKCSTASPWSLQQARTQAYALYVLTREGVVTTNQLLTVRDYLDTYYKKQWPHDLAAVYLAGCWSLLKKDDEARRLIDGYHLGQYDERERWDFYQPLGADAQYVAILARHFPDKLRLLNHRDFDYITAPIGAGEFSTLTAAYAVMALKAYSEAVAANPPHLSATALCPPGSARAPRAATGAPAGGSEQPLAMQGSATALLRGAFPPTATTLRFRADHVVDNPLGIFYQTTQSGFEHTVPAVASSRGIEVGRELLTPDGKPASRVKLGDRLTVRLRLRATRPQPVTNVAVLDLLPGGFEIVDNSLPPGTGTAGMDYVDVREDRAVLYGTATDHVHEITYQIKATARGEFTVPPIFAESMYDKKLQALGLGGHITVIDNK